MNGADRLPGAIAGFSLAGLPGFLFLLCGWLLNPAFMDSPLSAWCIFLGLPGIIGGLLGARFVMQPTRWPLLLAVGCATMVTGFSIAPVERLEGVELVVFGVDGATWSVIDDMTATGELPAFAAMRASGVSGHLRAPEPIFSPLVWTTMATGFEPSEHGIHGFNMTANAVKVPRFWNIAANQGHTVGIYKWLVTWPPEELTAGFMVPGWLAKSADAVPANSAS